MSATNSPSKSDSPSNRTKRRSLLKSSDSKVRKDTVAEAQELVGQLATKLATGEEERDAVIEDLQEQQVAYKHALGKLDAELAERRAELEERNKEVAALRQAEAEAAASLREQGEKLAAAAEAERRSAELAEEVKALRMELSQKAAQDATSSAIPEPEPEAAGSASPRQVDADGVPALKPHAD